MKLETLPQSSGSGVRTGKIVGHLSGWILGAAVLYGVALQTGPQDGTAIIHVTEPNVTVSVGNRSFQVGDHIYEPLVCELPAGDYRLTMTRGSTVLYVEDFILTGGEEHVLTTWTPPARSTAQAANQDREL